MKQSARNMVTVKKGATGGHIGVKGGRLVVVGSYIGNKAGACVKKSHKPFMVALSGGTAGELHTTIVSGIHVDAIMPVAGVLDIPAEDLAARVGMSRSTYHRKVQAGGTIDSLGSDALAKYAALFDKAVEAFDGDADAARLWLKTKQQGLGNRVPLDFARTTVGYREVEKLLTRIDYGVYA